MEIERRVAMTMTKSAVVIKRGSDFGLIRKISVPTVLEILDRFDASRRAYTWQSNDFGGR